MKTYKRLRATLRFSQPPTPQQQAICDDLLRQTRPLSSQGEKRIKLIDSLLKRYL